MLSIIRALGKTPGTVYAVARLMGAEMREQTRRPLANTCELGMKPWSIEPSIGLRVGHPGKASQLLCDGDDLLLQASQRFALGDRLPCIR